MEPLHSSAEMRALSNIGHWIEGGILAIVGGLAILEAAAVVHSTLLWPSFVAFAGLALLGYMFLHHSLGGISASWRLVIGDPQQRQHFLMALLLVLAGVAETFAILGFASGIPLGLMWPGALFLIGVLFLVHTQHGTRGAVSWAVGVHRYLGSILILAGLARLSQLMLPEAAWLLAFVWPAFLLIAAALLLIYREPAGAFEASEAHDDRAHHERH